MKTVKKKLDIVAATVSVKSMEGTRFHKVQKSLQHHLKNLIGFLSVFYTKPHALKQWRENVCKEVQIRFITLPIKATCQYHVVHVEMKETHEYTLGKYQPHLWLIIEMICAFNSVHS